MREKRIIRPLTALGLAVFCSWIPASAQVPAPLPAIAATLGTPDRYPNNDVTFPNGVKGISGVVYTETIGYRQLTLDLYLPPTSVKRPTTGFPLVLYIHGGAWLSGNSRRSRPFVDFPGVLASLSGKGYVVASLEYRLSSEAPFPAQIQDVKGAIKWLRLHASQYGIDPTRAVTWGVSSGGHLAALAALTCNTSALEPERTGTSNSPDAIPQAQDAANISDCVQGRVAWYGVFDMATIADQARKADAFSRETPSAPEWRLLGCFASACSAAQLAAASPVTYVNAKSPPMLLIVGNEDRLVPFYQTLEMAETLKRAKVKHDLIVLPGENHSFIGKTPQQTRGANLKALAATFEFIDHTIGNTAQ